MLSIRDLSVQINAFELENISIDVDKGNILVVLGPSGSGKTLFLETIAGRYKGKGSICLREKRIDDLGPEKRNIGFVYQHYELFDFLNVEENIRFPLKMKSVCLKVQDKRVEEAFDYFKIRSLKSRNVKNLSGGEKQRTALARIWVMEPDLILLDEPVSALDYGLRKEALEGVRNLADFQNIPVIYVTHSMEEALLLGDELIFLKEGRIQKRVGKEEMKKLKEEDLEGLLLE